MASTTSTFDVVAINEMVDYLEALVRVGTVCQIRKELIFDRVRELKSAGYVECVALAIALRDYRVIVGGWQMNDPAFRKAA